jgi:hypothetical protein
MASGKLLTKCTAALNVNRLKRWDILADYAAGKGFGGEVCNGQRLFGGSGSRSKQIGTTL